MTKSLRKGTKENGRRYSEAEKAAKKEEEKKANRNLNSNMDPLASSKNRPKDGRCIGSIFRAVRNFERWKLLNADFDAGWEAIFLQSQMMIKMKLSIRLFAKLLTCRLFGSYLSPSNHLQVQPRRVGSHDVSTCWICC